MRGIAYTDVVQGFILIVGCLFMLIIGFYAYGGTTNQNLMLILGLPAAYEKMLEHSPQLVAAPGKVIGASFS